MAGRAFGDGLSSSVGKYGPDVMATLSHVGTGQPLPCGLFMNEPQGNDQPNCEYDTPHFGDDDSAEVWPIRPLHDLTGPIELTVRHDVNAFFVATLLRYRFVVCVGVLWATVLGRATYVRC
jgi:hypothetical protein